MTKEIQPKAPTVPKELHQYLDVKLIKVQRKFSSAKKLLQEMATLLSQPLLHNSDDDDLTNEVYHCLLEREKIGNTGIGNGIALPHSRCSFTDKAIIAIITLASPIDYDSQDNQPIDVVFGLIVPEEATQEHLNLLASIAQMLSSHDNKQKLVKATSCHQVINLVKHWTLAKNS